MTDARSHMAVEIEETPDAVARFLDREGGRVDAAGRRLRDLDPRVIVTCARGSSDNAAAYFKYLSEILVGCPVASIGPSVASVYRAPLRLSGAVLVSVSQSGRSPDIVALQAAAQAGGAFSIAVVNETASPLGEDAGMTLALQAGEEKSVAATKTCIVSAVALAALVAAWRDDADLKRALHGLPDAFARALSCDWGAAFAALRDAASAYVVGRGPAFPVAAEAALKLKETAMVHAEAFSGAEVMHGPLQLLEDGFPVLALRQNDASAEAMAEAGARLAQAGGQVFVAEVDGSGDRTLPVAATGHEFLDPLSMLLSFYRLAEQVSRVRGHDPDRPSRLSKVTETV